MPPFSDENPITSLTSPGVSVCPAWIVLSLYQTVTPLEQLTDVMERFFLRRTSIIARPLYEVYNIPFLSREVGKTLKGLTSRTVAVRVFRFALLSKRYVGCPKRYPLSMERSSTHPPLGTSPGFKYRVKSERGKVLLFPEF